jgi:hypothetical protein
MVIRVSLQSSPGSVRSLGSVVALFCLAGALTGAPAGAAMSAAAKSKAAQDAAGRISGSIRDADFDAPLAGATVLIVETGQKTKTSDDGNYSLTNVKPGSYTITVSAGGYTRQVKTNVAVQPGQVTEFDASLTGEFIEEEAFTVADVRKMTAGTEASLLELRFKSPSLLDSISSELMSRAGASDAAAALRLVAGATVQDGKSAVIRGLPDRYVSSQMNGVRLPTADEDKRAVELDQFPSAVIESIQVSKTFTPDQQGDASGGAVNVRLKGVPDKPFFMRFKLEKNGNSQTDGRANFLSYEGGGIGFDGKDNGSRDIQTDRLGDNWSGAVGTERVESPFDYKWSWSAGGRFDLTDEIAVGGFASVFYDRNSSYRNDGIDDSLWVDEPGQGMVPKAFQGTVQDGDFRTNLFDVEQASTSVQWGSLVTLGMETDNNKITLSYLYTRTAEDSATLAEDTRGKEYFFPGHVPTDPTTPGHSERDAAPYLRLETLQYQERTTDTLQLSGEHTLPIEGFGPFLAPVLDWTLAKSSADLYEPDKRQFGSEWFPVRVVGSVTIPPSHRGYKPGANFTLGNLQRIWKDIEEDSDQYFANLKLPFEQWSDVEGYFKFGIFEDSLTRVYDQESFSNFSDNSSFAGPWEQFWSRSFPFEDHPITAAETDVDYVGTQDIYAYYGMLDLPITSWLSIVGGARYEETKIGIVNEAEDDATWYPKGATAPTQLNPGEADVQYRQDDWLPSVGLTMGPLEGFTFRAAYSETVARQTFKELSPILQQEFLGGPIFIGNPELRMSALKNYDLRLDYNGDYGTFVSVSWFKKDIEDPIEYVQRIVSFDYTTAVNYPKGELSGYEFELRQKLGSIWSALDGLGVGGNMTLIDSEVTLPEDEAAAFREPNIQAPMTSRDMTNAPEFLYNAYITYDSAWSGTKLGLFYTVQGDTLRAGAGESDGNFVPNVYELEYDTLNFSASQDLGKGFKLDFKLKNLTDSARETVYRSQYIGDDVTKTRFSKGIDWSLAITAEIIF